MKKKRRKLKNTCGIHRGTRWIFRRSPVRLRSHEAMAPFRQRAYRVAATYNVSLFLFLFLKKLLEVCVFACPIVSLVRVIVLFICFIPFCRLLPFLSFSLVVARS